MNDERPTINEVDIPDLLDNLVERSMVNCDPITGRYHMSESMRVYASDQLTGQEQHIEKSHFDYFVLRSDELLELNRLGEDAQAVALFLPEVDNFRQAFEWGIEHDAATCFRFMRQLGPSWFRVMRPEAESLARRALASVPDTADSDHVALRMHLAQALMRQHLFDEARTLLETAERQANEIEIHPTLYTFLILRLGVLEFYTGNNAASRERTLVALELAKKHSLQALESSAHTNLGEMCRAAGDFTLAMQHYEEAERLLSGDAFSNSLLFFNLGCTALELNDVQKAEDYFLRGLPRNTLMGIEPANGPIGGLGYICVLKARYREAGLLMGYPHARRAKNKARMDPVDERMFVHYRNLGSQLGGKEFDQAFEEGAHLTSEQLAKLIQETGREI